MGDTERELQIMNITEEAILKGKVYRQGGARYKATNKLNVIKLFCAKEAKQDGITKVIETHVKSINTENKRLFNDVKTKELTT